MRLTLTYTIGVVLFAFILNGCSKDEAEVAIESQIEWMRVLDENVSGNTETDESLGQNGKVITDQQGNIYLYYFEDLSRTAVVVKCDPEGTILWKKTFPDCVPMDMARRSDGDMVLAVRDLPGLADRLVIYVLKESGQVLQLPIIHTPIGGSSTVLNCNMYVMPDNSIVMTGAYMASFLVGSPESQNGFVLKLDQSYQKTWNLGGIFNLSLAVGSNSALEQNSVIPYQQGKFLIQFSVSTDPVQSDSVGFGYVTAIVDPDIGVINQDSAGVDTSIFTFTGYYVQSSGKRGGYYNRYANDLIPLGNGEAMHHFSAPVSLIPGLPANTPVPNGFFKIASDGTTLKDTVPIPLPNGYRLLSCSFSGSRFMATAYEVGAINVGSDFSANQTLFLVGDANFQTMHSFRFQDFNADLFTSTIPLDDGGFLIMGKIQSFNGPNNKLVLIKWKER
jgi:hypothetical protein